MTCIPLFSSHIHLTIVTTLSIATIKRYLTFLTNMHLSNLNFPTQAFQPMVFSYSRKTNIYPTPSWKNLVFFTFSDLKLLRSATNHYRAAIIKAKKLYNSSLISYNLNNPRKLWHTINYLLHKITAPSLPSSASLSSLPQSFATFFYDKIHKLHTSILTGSTTPSPHFPPPFKPPDLSFFQSATIDEVSDLLSHSPDTSCDLDPIPTTLLKKCKIALLPTITNIINLSLFTGIFPDEFKNCSVHPKLKKHNFDKENLSNYRPISHLSFISKLTERLVKNRLTEYLNQNNLTNSFQSAYTKFNSTETILLTLHDYIIRA